MNDYIRKKRLKETEYRREIHQHTVRMEGIEFPIEEFESLAFSEDTKEDLRTVLIEYKDKKERVDTFMRLLEEYCEKMHQLLSLNENKEIKDNALKLVKGFKRTLKNLKSLYKCEIPLSFKHTLDEWNPSYNYPKCSKEYFGPIREIEISKVAKKAIPQIERIIDELEYIYEPGKIPKGRPSADPYNFVSTIASLFGKYLGKPTKYYNGPFYKVVQIALEVIGLPYEDPSRSINSALSKSYHPFF